MTTFHSENKYKETTYAIFPYADSYMVYGEIVSKVNGKRYVTDKIFNSYYEARIYIEERIQNDND